MKTWEELAARIAEHHEAAGTNPHWCARCAPLIAAQGRLDAERTVAGRTIGTIGGELTMEHLLRAWNRDNGAMR